MIQEIITGIIQGITEWIPISSEGLITIISTNIFNNPPITAIQLALFLHLGTALATILYFRKEIIGLVRRPQKPLSRFIIASTITGGLSGLLIYNIITITTTILGNISTILISLMLIITAVMQRKIKNSGYKEENNVTIKEGVIFGFLQSLALIPGLSRSGIAYSTLALLKYKPESAIKISFLASIPVIIGVNIMLKITNFNIQPDYFLGVATAFITGIIAITVIMRISQKIDYSRFCVIIAMLNLLTLLI